MESGESGSMEDKVVFKDLTVQEFIHPGEEEAKRSLIQNPAFQKLIQTASEWGQKFGQTEIQGTYLHLTPETAPRLHGLLQEACRVLDFPGTPELYLCHKWGPHVLPYSGSTLCLLISDYVAERYDDDMLSYLFGNALTMMKAGHVEMTTVAAYMRQSLWALPLTIEFKRYLHLADATSDRGGLLACQTLAGAARCHFEELGIPSSETRKLFQTDEEAVTYIRRYLRAVEQKNGQDGIGVHAAAWWIDLNYVEAPANQMLEDLYTWYCSGYQVLLDRYRQ